MRRAAALLILTLGAAAACDDAAPPARRVQLSGYHPATADRLRADGWRTDFHRTEVPLETLARSESVPRDAFVPITNAGYASAAETDLDEAEPVIVFRPDDGDGVRAWPLLRLLRREIALTEAGDAPVAVTFCSVCGTARVWDRRLSGPDADPLELRVSGLLLQGNALLWDTATESLWRQDDGTCVAGAHAGRRLREIPTITISFGALRAARPDAEVLREPVAAPLPPLDVMRAADLLRGEPPEWMTVACPNPLELVMEADAGAVPVAGPPVENVGEVVLLRDADCASPYRLPDGAAGPVTGSAATFLRTVNGRRLTFEAEPGAGIVDAETGSRWTLLGEAVEGPLTGTRLPVLAARSGFRFAAGE